MTEALLRPEGIPADWIEKPTRTVDRREYINPNNPNDRVRVMRGNPNSPYPNQRRAYVIDQNGSYRDVNGIPIRGPAPGRRPEAHIPYELFRFRR